MRGEGLALLADLLAPAPAPVSQSQSVRSAPIRLNDPPGAVTLLTYLVFSET